MADTDAVDHVGDGVHSQVGIFNAADHPLVRRQLPHQCLHTVLDIIQNSLVVVEEGEEEKRRRA